jgi:hypothetical protein
MRRGVPVVFAGSAFMRAGEAWTGSVVISAAYSWCRYRHRYLSGLAILCEPVPSRSRQRRAERFSRRTDRAIAAERAICGFRGVRWRGCDIAECVWWPITASRRRAHAPAAGLCSRKSCIR